MTAAAEVLAVLHGLGVSLHLEEGHLKVRAPKGVMTAALQQDIRDHKAGLMALAQAPASPETSVPHLSPDQEPSVPAPDDPPGTVFHKWSTVLGQEFWILETDAQASAHRAQGHTAYSVREVKILQALREHNPEAFPEKLQALDTLREVFAATLDAPEPSPASLPLAPTTRPEGEAASLQPGANSRPVPVWRVALLV